MIRIGIDTGGTFTDFIILRDEKIIVHKVPSNPENPAQAILKGLRQILGKKEKAIIFHGTTVATNALLERKGSRVALITTKNFEDLLEIGRQNRSELYNLSVQKSETLVKSSLRFGMKERIAYDGIILEPLMKSSIRNTLVKIKKSNTQSIAICFLHSYANNTHEKWVEKEARKLSLPISVSSHILPEYREVERLSTTVVNAYVSPIIEQYLKKVSTGLKKRDILRIMQSNGGFTSAKTASAQGVRTLLSGPSAGVVAAFTLGKMIGFPNLITLDMGGTSTDVSLCPGTIPYSTEGEIAGCPLKTPFIKIHTIGAGGGSIAWIDQGGLLRVGPESAGADPGPISYGRGGKNLTVTDAHLILKRLYPGRFLGGKMGLEGSSLQNPLKQMAKQLNLSPIKLADGIVQIANANMERALRVVSIDQGQDPKAFALLVFGGAGGLHGANLAQALNIPTVIIPKNPGLFSAFGLLMADSIKEYAQTIVKKNGLISRQKLSIRMKELIQRGLREMKAEEIPARDTTCLMFLDMRYQGQSYEITVPFSEKVNQAFHKAHAKLYGYTDENRPIEIVNLRVRLIGKSQKPTLKPLSEKPLRKLQDAQIDQQKTFFSGKYCKTPVYDRDRLTPGTRFLGPAVVSEFSSTTVVPPEFKCRVDPYENLILEYRHS